MIVLNPITLPASKMLATMTALIGEIRFKETLAPSDIVNDLVDSCRIGKVDFGKGIVYTYKTNTQPTKDLSETSTAFSINKPSMAQETIEIDNYKFVPISISEVLTRDAVLSGDLISTFDAFAMSLLEDTAQFNLFDVCNAMYQDWTPKQATQTISITQKDTSALTGADLQAALTWNANEIARVMRKTLNNMKIKNTKFTDVTGQVSALRGDDLKLVMNDKYWTDILSNSIATLYHSEKIGEMIPGDKFVLLPEDAMASKNATTIGWLSSKEKFALADFYKLALSILDPSTMYQNSFYHYSYGAGVFQHAPGVKFVANVAKA